MMLTYRMLVILAATAALGVAIAWFRVSHGGWVQALCATWFVMVRVTSLRLLVAYDLPNSYFRSRGFEKSSKIYRTLGVPFLRRLVRRGPVHILAPALQYSGRRESLPALERETRKAESAHATAFLASLPLVAYALFSRWPASAGWLLLFTFLLNIYPVMLQRDNRARLERAIRRTGFDASRRRLPDG
jgi:hypothetical protein